LLSTTTEYRRAVLDMLLKEANRVSKALKLPEKAPITEADVVETYVTPPKLAERMRTLGNVATRQYRYYVSVDRKFSFLEKVHGGDPTSPVQDYNRLKSDYLWSIQRRDTNAALSMAAGWLEAVSMDVNALNRDCQVDVRAWTPEGPEGKHFVPLYWVRWYDGNAVVAMVELVEPTKSLRQLRVNRSGYIRRPALEVPVVIRPSTPTKAVGKARGDLGP
jgi:hypothetical protein